MKKDIHPPKVEDVAVAIVKEKKKTGDQIWTVYLLNMKEETIEGVLVSSKGYGKVQGEALKTSMLRHFLDTLPPQSYAKVEIIPDELLGLSNEYWVSFYLDGVMHDKKYVFLAETIIEDNMIDVPLLDKKGIMIQ